jgi:FMN phosphatase YigB (HAD superfamily)
VIVSDNYRENIEYISNKYHFETWSIKQVYPFDYKMVKTNPDFFKILLEQIKGYSTKDMLFIDDRIEKLESAEKWGIKGILYRNNNQINKELREHGR